MAAEMSARHSFPDHHDVACLGVVAEPAQQLQGGGGRDVHGDHHDVGLSDPVRRDLTDAAVAAETADESGTDDGVG
ncbi:MULTISPECIES: hypothetical protein [unclassified Streptomyces]|uniref:hypothetical protein n=1 Tax=unclassified Streptomyces TaxID=2593676 RepID=UPI001F3F1117|nr:MULTISPECIES: hypothetical protein [unclassified Streptomyces]